MPSNSAAWLTAPCVSPLEIKPAPYTKPKTDEIVIRNGAVAINPIDGILQRLGTSLAFGWLKYPIILGSDVAGEVVEVGNGVTDLKPGDRVLGFAMGTDKSRNSAAEGGFQLYTVLLPRLTTRIPSTMSFQEAAVLPLGLSTAACALFQKSQLGLECPVAKPKPKGKTLLVWGGSTSVGNNAIQLAVAAGYEVFTTSSPKNFEYVKKLGAAQAFDYNSAKTIPNLIRAFQGKTTAGAIAIGQGSSEACMAVMRKCQGNRNVSMATLPIPTEKSTFFLIKTVASFLYFFASTWMASKLGGVRYQFIMSQSLAYDGVGKMVYNDFLPTALSEARYIAAPEPFVVGSGLQHIQAALDLQKQGISARKLVVSL